MKGSTTADTVRYSLVESACDYADVKRGIPQSNRGLVPTAFSWCRFDESKYKLSEFRQWRTNPFADFSLRTLERFERVVLDRVAGRVSNDEAARAADALVGPPVDSPTSRAYCRCGCGPNIGAVDEALRRSMLGVSPRAAVEDIAMAYGLDDAAQESVLDEVNEQLEDLRRMGRLAHV